jgi:uncharacterized membrane protein YbhN (UPF0104 family)
MSTPPQAAPTHIGRQALNWAIKIVVSGGLLYWLFSGEDINFASVLATVRAASPVWLLMALLIYFLVLLISTWRWRGFLTAQHIDIPFRTLVGSYLVATFFNNFLLSNVGGDVVRITDTARAAKSKTLAAMIVLVDRGIGLLGLGFLAATGATVTAWVSPTLGPMGPGILWAGLSIAIAGVAWAVWMPHGVGALLRPLRMVHQEWVGERIEQLMTTLHKFRNSPRALLGGFAASVLSQAMLVGFYAAIARALHFEIPIANLAVVVPISFIVQMLPTSVGGLGVRESTFVLYLKPFGVARQAALTLSLTSGVLIVLFSLSGAVAYLIRKK